MNSALKVQLLQVLWAKRRLQISDSFYQFCIDAYEVINPGDKLEINWHIEEICNKLQDEVQRIGLKQPKTKDLIINVPPRTLKSFITAIAMPAWTWIKYPSTKFIGVSYSATLSIEHSVKCRRLIESAWYQRQFSDSFILTSDQNTKSKFENNKAGMRTATSVGGTITGTGADIILIDDPVNPSQASSEAERTTANKFFDETLSTRLNDAKTGLFIVVMQRLHQKDLTGYLLEKEPTKWFHICLPARQSIHVRPPRLNLKYKHGLLFPERLSQQVLSDAKSRLGTFGFSGQYEQLPAPDEGGIIKKKWFKIITWEEFLKIKDESKKEPVWNFYVDTAYTSDNSNDPSAFLGCTLINNILFIRNSQTRHFEFPELIKFIPDFVRANGYSIRSRIYVEPKASGKSVVQQLRRATLLNIIEAPAPEKDKMTRVNAITPTLEAGRCMLIQGNWNQPYLDELGLFPNASNDDQVDTTVMAIDRVIKGVLGNPKATR